MFACWNGEIMGEVRSGEDRFVKHQHIESHGA